MHLLNAGKYLSALIAVSAGLRVWYATREVQDWREKVSSRAASFADRAALDAFLEANAEPSGATTEMRATFFFFQAVATVYGAAWDLFMDWSVVSLVRQTRDSEEVITGAEGGTNPSRSRFGAARDAKKTATDLSLPRGYRLRWLERRTLIKSRWKYGAAVVLNLALRHFWIVAAVPDAREGVALGAEAWVTVAALVEVLRRCAWSYFRVENEHATNCGAFRATLEVPLPFRDGELTDDEEDTAVVFPAVVTPTKRASRRRARRRARRAGRRERRVGVADRVDAPTLAGNAPPGPRISRLFPNPTDAGVGCGVREFRTCATRRLRERGSDLRRRTHERFDVREGRIGRGVGRARGRARRRFRPLGRPFLRRRRFAESRTETPVSVLARALGRGGSQLGRRRFRFQRGSRPRRRPKRDFQKREKRERRNRSQVQVPFRPLLALADAPVELIY